MSEHRDIHVHLHLDGMGELLAAFLTDRRMLREILKKLEHMESKMATIDDLNTAVDGIQGVLTANDARVAALATAVSDAAATSAANDAAMQAEIKRLNDLLAAGGDPTALQASVDKLTAMSAEAVTEGQAIDSATSALAAAFPKTPPAP
jgi:ABC-type transporter Mla subunit MlaD